MKLSQIKAPAIAGVVKEKSERCAIAEIKNCMYDGATIIDLHTSCLESSDTESLRRIIASTPLPVLALNYNVKYDCKSAGFSEEERAAPHQNGSKHYSRLQASDRRQII